MMLAKRKPYRNDKVRKAAEGEECTLNSPWCTYDASTTVFCHLNESYAGKGMGQKADDVGFFACAACHAGYDQGRLRETGIQDWFLLRAVYRTIRRLIDKGVLK